MSTRSAQVIAAHVADKIRMNWYPGQEPYLDAYAQLCLESFFSEDPLSADRLLAFLNNQFGEAPAEVTQRINQVWERWQHWTDLLLVTTRSGRLRLSEPLPGYEHWSF